MSSGAKSGSRGLGCPIFLDGLFSRVKMLKIAWHIFCAESTECTQAFNGYVEHENTEVFSLNLIEQDTPIFFLHATHEKTFQ